MINCPIFLSAEIKDSDMNAQWQAFLESRSAIIGEDGLVRFENSGTGQTLALYDLSHLGLIRLSGEDAADFLQGQVTNDIRELTPDRCQFNGCCDPKGHLLANFWAFRRDGDIFLQLPGNMLPSLLKRLSMFVLRAKVAVTDASDDLVRIGVAGEGAEALLGSLIPEPPAGPGGVTHTRGLTLVRLPGDRPRFEIIGEAPAVEKLWEQLSSRAAPTDSACWALLDIRAGIPTVYPATAGAFIPQMINMQLIGGVSFQKGCYCGQEIVARTQHRGTLKRRMYLAHIATDRPPAAGDELFSPSAEHGKAAGVVVDARPAPEGGCDALVMVQIPCFEADDIHLGDSEAGPKLEFRDLPYALEG